MLVTDALPAGVTFVMSVPPAVSTNGNRYTFHLGSLGAGAATSIVLNAAYNDSQGITAEFNRNILRHINTVVGAEFDPDNFEHRAFYDSDKKRIEMHLVSRLDQSVPCNGATFEFTAGESIQTEYSYKYTVPGFRELARSAGLEVRQSWLDEGALFSVHYLEPANRGK